MSGNKKIKDINKRMRQFSTTSTKKKLKVGPTQGGIVDSAGPSKLGKATDPKQQNPKSVKAERQKQVAENERKDQLRKMPSTGLPLPAQEQSVTSNLDDGPKVELVPENRDEPISEGPHSDRVGETVDTWEEIGSDTDDQPLDLSLPYYPLLPSSPNIVIDVHSCRIPVGSGLVRRQINIHQVLGAPVAFPARCVHVIEPHYPDMFPIVISSDESDEGNGQNGGNGVVVISDSEDEREGQKPQIDERSVDVMTAPLDLTNLVHQDMLEEITSLHPLVKLSAQMTSQASDFNVLRVIGAGTFGMVFLVRKVNGYDVGRVYAMKAIAKIGTVNTLQNAKHIRSERVILETIQGTPFVVCLHYAFQDDQYLYLVTNLAQGGEMYRRVKRFGSLPLVEVLLYVAEMVAALEHLHAQWILYRDLKLENILLDAEGHIVLADLGLATILTAENHLRAHEVCGTLEYMAPEVLALKPEGYSLPVDWWSLGVVTVELLSGVSPFTNTNLPISEQRAETERRILHEEPQIPTWLSTSGIDLLKKMLDKDPSRRIDARGILEHAFFKSIDWRLLRERAYIMPFRPDINAADDVRNFDRAFTSMPAVVPESEILPPDLYVYSDYEYTSPQILDWARLVRDEGVEYNSANVERLPTRPNDLMVVSLVYRSLFCSCFKTNRNLFVKMIHLSNYHSSEPDALMNLDHPHIVRYYGTCRNRTEVWIVMEYLTGGTLKTWIDNGCLNERISRDILLQLVYALLHMHNRHFVYGDLKPENVVCERLNSMKFKLVDFGNASYSSAFTQWEENPRYTLDYAPPELLTNNGKAVYSPAVDIFGLGATLYCMVVGHPPFRDSVEDVTNSAEKRAELWEKIKQLQFNQTSEKWITASQEFRDLVTACMQKDPFARPKLCEISTWEWTMRRFHRRRAQVAADAAAAEGFQFQDPVAVEVVVEVDVDVDVDEEV